VNLQREGIPLEKIHRVGNVMIDTLVRLLPAAEKTNGIPGRYALVTLHRPSNVDCSERLREILKALLEIQNEVDVVFPVHPRTRDRLAELALDTGRLRLLGPLPYIEFLALQRRAAVVITDSGGIQEETTFLRVPCLTLRTSTERPITVSIGSNVLVGEDLARLREETSRALRGQAKQGGVPPLWDGQAAERIADIVMKV
jgi:UDP-N-acetylglucosamine 2-epimerase (non-hydrolysing)